MADQEESKLSKAWKKVKKAAKRAKNAVIHPLTDRVEGKNFSEAYQQARKEGKKTFIWSGDEKVYTTNYNGTPQEQLSTYGITNEQLQDRSWWQDRLAKNIAPIGYSQPVKRVFETVILNEKEDKREKIEKGFYKQCNNSRVKLTIDYFNVYNGLPQQYNNLSISDWKPSITKNNNDTTYYYKDNNLTNDIRENLSEILDNFAEKKVTKGKAVDACLRKYTISIGQDEHGHYISYYDKWDLAALEPAWSKDISSINTDFGIPFEVYDRIYFDPQTKQPIDVKPQQKSYAELRNTMRANQILANRNYLNTKNNLQNSSTKVENKIAAVETMLTQIPNQKISKIKER